MSHTHNTRRGGKRDGSGSQAHQQQPLQPQQPQQRPPQLFASSGQQSKEQRLRQEPSAAEDLSDADVTVLASSQMASSQITPPAATPVKAVRKRKSVADQTGASEERGTAKKNGGKQGGKSGRKMWRDWDEDLLLDMLDVRTQRLEKWLTLKQDWITFAAEFTAAARANEMDYPVRDGDAVQNKWRRMLTLATNEPTGNTEPPRYREQAVRSYAQSQRVTGTGNAGERWDTSHPYSSESSAFSDEEENEEEGGDVEEEDNAEMGVAGLGDVNSVIRSYSANASNLQRQIQASQVIFDDSEKTGDSRFNFNISNSHPPTTFSPFNRAQLQLSSSSSSPSSSRAHTPTATSSATHASSTPGSATAVTAH